jgi:hypothetical protein
MFALIVAVIPSVSLPYICGRTTAKFAAQRGRSKVGSSFPWFVLGCLFFSCSIDSAGASAPARRSPRSSPSGRPTLSRSTAPEQAA